MKRMKHAITCLAFVLSSYASAGSVERSVRELPEIAPPPQAEVQWIAKNMRHNGLPMKLQAFRSRLSAAEVLRHYEANIAHDSTREHVRSRNGAWQILAFKDARSFVTIQARDTASGSVGTIVVSSTPAVTKLSLRTRFPVPPSLRIVNLQEYDDDGIESEHISLVSARAPHLEAASCAQLLSRVGWSIVLDAPAQTIAGGRVIEAQKGAEHARLTFLPDRSDIALTGVIIVWRKA